MPQKKKYRSDANLLNEQDVLTFNLRLQIDNIRING